MTEPAAGQKDGRRPLVSRGKLWYYGYLRSNGKENAMDKFVPIGKQSKKKRKEFNAKQRKTWGELKPVTRTVPSGKAYNRKKRKAEERRSSGDLRHGPAAFCLAK